ncbi:ADP-ribose pyrophosphatase, mitochondrial [Coccinella septempunctata]|uniref:ADP-ribose pyrophosphatase, mitochondrial n=1 Tax=Coccinella septempunctata TaxID=41139 RepID=UPI001D099B51|nr:ADP-ribose pyrophosphatase, mitochondrial [Coccinella septempunctata]
MTSLRIFARMVHKKCRSPKYPFGDATRLPISDEEVPWNVKISYNPPEYESPGLKNKPWADPYIDDTYFCPKFNFLDGNVDRVSFMGTYMIENKRPLNPEGRTGLRGRGILGRWGPSHAADPIVTRWKISEGVKEIHSVTNLPILQFCAIQRHDCNEWAIPGGFVDPGENVSETLRREFAEEAFKLLETDKEEAEKINIAIADFFKEGKEIYKGYVDDPRNTDNAWIETVAMNFHDETGETVGKFDLKAGDDAKNVLWLDIDKNLELYASHLSFIEAVAKLHNAHW